MSTGWRINLDSLYRAYFNRVLQEDLTILDTEEMYGRGPGKILNIGGKTTTIGSWGFLYLPIWNSKKRQYTQRWMHHHFSARREERIKERIKMKIENKLLNKNYINSNS